MATQLLDLGLLLIRQDIRQHLVDSDAPRDGLGRTGVVAGHHDDVHTATAEFGDGGNRTFLDRIGNYHESGEFRVNCDEHHTLALGAVLFRPWLKRCGVDTQLSHQRGIAQRDWPFLDHSGDTLACLGGESAAGWQAEPTLLRAFDDCCRQRMLAALFDGGRESEHVGVVKVLSSDNRNEGRFAQGQRSGLVDHQSVDLFQEFERLGIFDEHAGGRAAAGADHDRHRRRKTECAGEGNDLGRQGSRQ